MNINIQKIFDETINNILTLIQTEVALTILKISLILVTIFVFKKFAKKLIDVRIAKFNLKNIKVDTTQFNFIRHFISGMIYFLGVMAIIYSIAPLRAIAVSIFASSGILAIIIGFASQQTFSNLVSGVFISLFQPFRIGDRVSFIGKGTTGIVEDITLRHTIIRTFENRRIIIPNSVISDEMIENANLIDEKICNFLDFGISYDSDIDKAMNIIKDEVIKHRFFLDNRTEENIKNGDEPVPVRLISFGDSSVNLRAWAWAKDSAEAFVMKCDLNKSIKERFDMEGIEIPYPYRTIVYKRDEEVYKN